MRRFTIAAALVALIASVAFASIPSPYNTQYDGSGCGGQRTLIITSSTDTTIDLGCAVTSLGAWLYNSDGLCSLAVYGEYGTVQMTKGSGSASERTGEYKQDTELIPLTYNDVFKRHTTIKKGLAFRFLRIKGTQTDTLTYSWDTDE